MKKIPLIAALMLCLMLPLTATAKPSPSSKNSKSDQENTQTPEQSNGKSDSKRMYVNVSDEQILLLNKSVDAVMNQNYSDAELILDALRAIQENNVVWYHLGRVYALQNKCMQAYDALNRVDSADAVNPDLADPELIESRTRIALEELDKRCSAKIVLVCQPEEMVLSIDGNKGFNCSKDPVPVVPGKHTINGKTEYGFISQDVIVAEGQTEEVRINVHNFDYYPVMNLRPETIEQKSRSFKIAGYSLLGAGFLGMIVSSGFMGYYASQDNHDDNKLKYTYAFFGVSGAIAVTGAVLLIINASYYQTLLDNLMDDVEDDDRLFTIDFAPVVSPSFSGLTLNGRF